MDKFAFVVSNGPRVPKDPALRTLIRKQAMRDVALERRKRGKGNLKRSNAEDDDGSITVQDGSSSSSRAGSSSVSSSASSSPPTDTTPMTGDLICWDDTSLDIFAEHFWKDMQATVLTTIIPNPLSAYEALCAEHNADLEQLSGLTTFGVSTPIVAMLADPKRLSSLLGHNQETFLRYVPSRYGKVDCITATVDCVMAKFTARLHCHDTAAEAKALTLYSKALQEVQRCVADERKSKQADTICAIMLLCLYELLDPTKGQAFQQHIFGIAHLARHRKASSFTTDYDKMLLLGSLGSTVIESIMRWDHCYLEQPEWQEKYLSIQVESTWLTSRSPVALRIHLSETRLSGLITDTNLAMVTGAFLIPSSIDILRQRLDKQHRELLECMDLYRAHLMQTSLLQPPPEELGTRRQLLGSAIEHLLIIKRLLGAICDPERLRLELEVRALSALLDEIMSQPGPQHAWLFSEHENSVLHCIKNTRELWEEDLSAESVERQQQAQAYRWSVFCPMLTENSHEPISLEPLIPNPTSTGWCGRLAPTTIK